MHVGHELAHFFMKGLAMAARILYRACGHEEKDRGVFVRSDLKVSNHALSAAKSRRIIGMVKRHFRRL